jgi:hypothetical protein
MYFTLSCALFRNPLVTFDNLSSGRYVQLIPRGFITMVLFTIFRRTVCPWPVICLIRVYRWRCHYSFTLVCHATKLKQSKPIYCTTLHLFRDANRQPTALGAIQPTPPVRGRKSDLPEHAFARPIWKDPGNAHASHQRSRGHDGVQVSTCSHTKLKTTRLRP